MLKEWQFNVLFVVGVGAAILLLLGPSFGLSVSTNPTALAGVGSILTYILTQKRNITKPRTKGRHSKPDGTENDEQKEGNES